MLDFGALPPEVNSDRLYAGPGSGPIMAAASAWQAMAGQLESIVRGYTAAISGLQGETWSGNASSAMANAAAPYIDWIATAATKAEETAGQARAAAAAYEAAFAAMVPPALVTANRAQYTALVAANIFGQYTAQIAAIEAAYADMWAQDAQAMYSYALASSTATTLTPFSEPPQTTTATGQSAQAAAVTQAAGSSSATTAQSTLSQILAGVPKQLQSLAATGSTSAAVDPSASLLTAFSNFNTLAGPENLSRGLQPHGDQRRKLPYWCLPGRSAGPGSTQDRRGRRGSSGGPSCGWRQRRDSSVVVGRNAAAGARRYRAGRTDRRAVRSADLGFGDPDRQRVRGPAMAFGDGSWGGSSVGRHDDGRHAGRTDGRHDPTARRVVASDGQQHPAGAGGAIQDAPSVPRRVIAFRPAHVRRRSRHGLSGKHLHIHQGD